jgi:Family of unknown function (DUF6283)
MTEKKAFLSNEIQCAKCPWKISTDPNAIPNGYSKRKHQALKKTIATPDRIDLNALHIMACHESPSGEETFCIGWLSHQLGPGNNIGLRFKMLKYDLSRVKTIGKQHPCFWDTLPK